MESNYLDLLLGYFSSSAINVLSLGFAKFLNNGGKVRMVVNHILSEQDKNAILKGQYTFESTYNFSVEDIRRLRYSLDEYGRHFFECLAWLISSKRIQIRAIRPKSGQGVAHYKSGLFSDGTNQIRFKSSCNFTASGFLENLEELSIRCSWKSQEDVHAIEEYKSYFENLFHEKADFVEYIPIQDVEVAIYNEFGNKHLNELIIQEDQLLRKKLKLYKNPHLQETIDQFHDEIENYLAEPRFPYPSGPRTYQIEAYQNWINNGYKGVFAMATGTGKTITSLNCVLKEYQQNPEKNYRAVILVPTIALVEQWEKEAKAFNFQNIIKVSSKNEWKSELSTILTSIRFGGNHSLIIICTYATFYREQFQTYFRRLPQDTVLIADEGHNIASPKVLGVLPNVHLQKRIGLSATPKRIYDPYGTGAMETFFQDAEPYTYTFSMERAIEEGVLCQYRYFPHLVPLNEDELGRYIEISKKLVKLYDHKKGEHQKSDLVEKLLLARKRIVQKAEIKLGTTHEILKRQFIEQGNLKFTFIYVPEGFAQNDDDVFVEAPQDLRLINQYTQAIGSIHPKILVASFTGTTPDRKEVLRQFQGGEIHVLASMKCLDEGVDIPRAEFAVFCSSTGNPRQFIQRRGRVLRQHPDKHLAIIHDLVVEPDLSGQVNEETYNMERNMVKKELERVAHFAFMSINQHYTLQALEELGKAYELNLFTIHQELLTQ
ncbi:MAG TPA: DEAD/DEAH box helicase family protein [Saprospiraceae bacterium]|nr:DEAD/DEAH box helicase family protein [Saprospiraceae bacterium]HMQ81606.1 DEAD/DEAH box helicase family protein [Saprospiraceae bacterium]